MSIPIVAALLLAEALLFVVVLFIIYRFQVRPKTKVSTAAKRKDTPGWVYEFVDPDTGVVVYVGQSANVEKRVDQHLRVSMTTGLLNMWIADLVQQGKRPIVRKVVQGNGRNELVKLENERITMHIAAGVKLFNHQVEGGK
jgi:hypothetical protein